MSRRRPLHTFGASILAIMHNSCTKAQELNGPIGSLIKRITTWISSGFPFIYTMQYQWLAILSFVDDHFLTLESMVETFFPPSIHLFNGIDKLVYSAECLPGRFDDALNTFSKIMQRLPFLDRVLMHLISWLNFLISALMFWGSKSTLEKDILIDKSCNNPRTGLEISMDKADDSHNEFPSISTCYPLQENIKEVGKEEHCFKIPKTAQFDNKDMIFSSMDSLEDERKTFGNAETPADLCTSILSENVIPSPTYNRLQDEIKSVGMRIQSDTIKCSYKDMLEKGTKENVETEEDNHNTLFETPRSTISDEEFETGTEKDINKHIQGFNTNDPILELFEASWHLKY